MNEETSWSVEGQVFVSVHGSSISDFHISFEHKYKAEYGYSFRTSHPRISHSPVATQQLDRRTWGWGGQTKQLQHISGK